MTALDLRAEMQRYGASDASVKLLDARNASLLRYVDLFPESLQRKGMAGSPMPDGILEHDDRPLIYLYRADSLAVAPSDREQVIAEVVRSLACRDEGNYLAVVHPGELVVYPVGLLRRAPRPETFKASAEHSLLVYDLASGNVPSSLRQQSATARSLHRMLYELITHAAKELRACKALSTTRERDEVLPLIGRAVFTRFLVDRGIINRATFPLLWADENRPEHAFDSPELAARTCVWLDHKFNGELLPLLFDKTKPVYEDYLAFFQRRKVAEHVLKQLTHVMYRAPDGRLSLDLAWQGVDFAHVPIGLLSEVYEDYAHEFYRDDALRESVRYTPRHIAEFTIAHAFEGLPPERLATARVLDPACGAGIFLVLALQRLVAENWRATGKRPLTEDIRRILNSQIRGYDINHSAMTLAALSLYLTALELDPDPFPPEKLRFDRLLGSVLHNMRRKDEQYPYDGMVLGSLGEKGDPNLAEPLFDVVTGNPPWTSLDKWRDKDNVSFSAYAVKMVKRIVSARRREATPALTAAIANYQHVDNIPDIAFLWRSIEWARDDGVIALIVAGRFLFKRGDAGARMRNALFRALRVTGILNGALLMPLWKKINQPFCIVFARNRAAELHDRFTFVTPVLDTSPTLDSRMRIDAEARQPIEVGQALARPHLFKALTRGGRLDVDIVDRIQALIAPDAAADDSGAAPGAVAIQDVWRQPWTAGRKRSGQGYKPGLPTSPAIRQRVARLLLDEALSLTSDDLVGPHGDIAIGLRVSPTKLSAFRSQVIHRMASPDICKPPLVLIAEGFGQSASKIRARLYLGPKPLAFRRNFYGFSCAGHPEARRLAKLLFCIVNSELFGYYTLMASAKFGLERRTLYVEDIEDFPIPRTLTDVQWKEVEAVADALTLGNDASWKAMNRCISGLYGLTRSDEQVMQDTLATMMPYNAAQQRGRTPARRHEIQAFAAKMQSALQPLFTPDDERISVKALPVEVDGWVAFEIATSAAQTSAKTDDLITTLSSRLAEDEGVTRVFQVVSEGLCRVVIRNQYRYLTLSRARLCAIDVMRDHGAAFPIPETTK